MQSMYVADIGDYGKFGLLRALFHAPYKLGIVWYMVPKQCLIDDRAFQSWTLESVASTIKQHTDKKWIDNVIDRYLGFGKIRI